MLRETAISILFLAAFTIDSSYAQVNSVHYTPVDGLVQTQCETVFQDSKGYIWIGTKSGLSRFNGYEFENFDSTQSLIGKRILHISEASPGQISAFYPAGFFKIQDRHVKQFKFPSDYYFRSYTNIEDRIFILCEKNRPLKKFILFSIINDTLSQIDIPRQLQNSLLLRTCSNSKLNRLFLCQYTADSLHIFKYQTNTGFSKQQSYKRHKDSGYFFDESRKQFFSPIFPNQKLMMITPEGVLWKWNRNEPQKTEFKIIHDRIFWADDSMIIYIRADSIFNKRLLKPEELITVLPSVNRVISDTEGNFWLADESGLHRITPFYNYSREAGIFPVVWSINEFPEGIIRMFSLSLSKPVVDKLKVFDYKKDGICEFENKYQNDFSEIEKTLNGRINFYMGSKVLSDNKLYIMSSRGVFRIDKKGVTMPAEDPMSESFFIYEDSLKQKVLIGRKDALYQYDFKEKQLSLEKIFSDFSPSRYRIALCAERGNDQALYIGTGRGLARYDYDTLMFMHKNSMPFSGIRSIVRDKKGMLWLGSENGLWHYDYRAFTRIVHPELNRQVTALLTAESGSLLVGSRRGIALIDIDSYYQKTEPTITFYDQSAGYFGGEVGQNGFFQDSKGNVWIAGKDAVVRFDFKKLMHNMQPPKVYIETVKASKNGTQTTSITPNTLLMSDFNSLEFKFSGISHGAPGRLRYKYMLENYEKAPSPPTKIRTIRYNHLPAGKYTFKLWAANESNIWTKEPARFTFTVKKSFFERLEVKLSLYFLLAVGLMAISLSLYRIYRKRKENRKQFMDLQMLSATGQLYPHFLFNAVTGISNAIYRQKAAEAYKYTTKLVKLVRLVHENRKTPTITLSEELEFINAYLEIQKYRFGKRFDYKVCVPSHIDLNIQIPQMLLQTFVENAVKHGLEPLHEGGFLELNMEVSKSELIIRIADNGVGRKVSIKNPVNSSGRGIRILQQMIDLYNKRYPSQISFKISDRHKKGLSGTKVIIRIAIR